MGERCVEPDGKEWVDQEVTHRSIRMEFKTYKLAWRPRNKGVAAQKERA